MANSDLHEDVYEFDIEPLDLSTHDVPVDNILDGVHQNNDHTDPTSSQDNHDDLNTVHEIPIPDDISQDTSDESSLDVEDYYEISTDSDEEYPNYPLNNLDMTTIPDERNILLIDQDDEIAGDWVYEHVDSGPSLGPFMQTSYTPITNNDKKPEVYFNALFDEIMWQIIADSTNFYATSKRNGKRCSDPTHPDYKKFCRLNTWSHVNAADIKLFMAHILIMGLVNKSDVEKYWHQNTKTKIPFFGKYMSRNRFQAILWNLHINDDSHNPPSTQPGHDPLCKIRPVIDMVKRNFLYAHKPLKSLSFDEACCPFKGRVKFRVYNPMKPNRFHIKLFQVSESKSGYILAFHVYTGKDSSCVSKSATPLDIDCTKTTKIVLGLLEESNLLDKGHHVYMDNYYSSPELFFELFYRQTYACGTARQIRKGMPKTFSKAKLKPLESAFLRHGPLLCLKWSGPKRKSSKKPVTMLSTIHEANELLTKKKDKDGHRIPKPVCIHDYTKKMSGVDISDQYLSHHVALRKSMKWSRKLFFHIFNMIILNSYLLNNKYSKRMDKQDYIEHIASYLVDSSVNHATSLPQRISYPSVSNDRLLGKHFPEKNPSKHGQMCRACNFTPAQLSQMGVTGIELKRKTTSFMCKQCQIPLCVTPCFEIYHTFTDYRNICYRRRIKDFI